MTSRGTQHTQSIVLGTVGTAMLLLVAFLWAVPRAPLDLAAASWATIRHVQNKHAPFAADVLDGARQHHNRAWIELQGQMQRFPLLRSFHKAEILFIQAMGLAGAAESIGQLAEQRTKIRMVREVGDMRRELAGYESELRHSLKSMALRSLATRAELKISLVEQNLATTQESEALIEDARSALADLQDALAAAVQLDAAMAPLWADWFQETLEWSRSTDSSAVLVVKNTHCGYLLRGGMVVYSFPIELGYHPGRQKMHSGDGATPEGMFRIIARRDTGAAYYRALDLDYPTFPDSIRYHVALKLGDIPPGKGIGGNIQIHGEGGRHIDWTDGCVAVTNEQMDILMERLDVGDRVTIVRQLDGWPQ